ncbi:MAG: DUF1223 domain-containing protein [Halioglobus sp.]
MRKILAVVALASLLFATIAPAQEQLRFSSGSAQATLLELYTSEGCSSCPPADRWYSTLLAHPRLWQSVVPVSFHVDYWNHLGWDDRFSKAEFSSRQRQYKREGNLKGVYTPGVVAAGHEWRNWRTAQLKIPTTGEVVGVLSLDVSGAAFSAAFQSPSVPADASLTLNVAILGFGLQSPIKAGENRGKLLEHDFVVLGYQQYVSQAGQWQGEMPVAPLRSDASRVALAAWVSSDSRQQPLQALGGWL